MVSTDKRGTPQSPAMAPDHKVSWVMRWQANQIEEFRKAVNNVDRDRLPETIGNGKRYLILNGHIAKAEEKRRNMTKESEGILDRTTKLEETLKRIWEVGKDLEVDDARVDRDGYDPALMGIMGEEEEELRQLLDNQPPPPPPPKGEGEGDEAGRSRRNGFVPIGSAQWLEGKVFAGRIEMGLSGRRKWCKMGDKPRRRFVHMRYVSRLMEAVSVRALIISLMTVAVGQHFAEWMETVTFGWFYNEPVSGILYKPAEVFRDFNIDRWENSKGGCACNGRYARFTNPATKELLISGKIGGALGPHIITTDYTISRLPQLRMILQSGLNHILSARLDIEIAVREVLKDFDETMTLYNKEYDLQEEMLSK
ncbi:hypothetical protein CBR_g25910 [Chara braunii]|uniref:Uncharacterized protein n=1 Tax=Chara braunii TaxID=69332 RepID=A0A388L6Q0_CHABU|nr:hypothetical protein CBR_g25910 [Chara braunii]|eukprot:GBG77979.1 hypothetical protein CBR_g25910 [Chara braunii]